METHNAPIVNLLHKKKKEVSMSENLYSWDWITRGSKSMDVSALTASLVYKKVQIRKTENDSDLQSKQQTYLPEYRHIKSLENKIFVLFWALLAKAIYNKCVHFIAKVR